MKIGELSSLTGVSPEMIRYYEKEGLLDPPERLDNNYRSFGSRHLARLTFIAHCRKLDMSLADIRAIMNCDGRDPEEAAAVHALLHRQIAAVDSHISDLKLLRSRLIELEKRCGGHGEGRVCGIISGLAEPDASR